MALATQGCQRFDDGVLMHYLQILIMKLALWKCSLEAADIYFYFSVSSIEPCPISVAISVLF